MSKIAVLSKSSAAVLKWVNRAASKDDRRPVLTGVNVNGAMCSTNGFSLHACPTPEDVTTGLGHGLYNVDGGTVPTKGGPVMFGEIAEAFPPYERVLPTKPVTFEYTVDPKLLIDALTGLNANDKGCVVLKFRAPDDPIEVFGKVGDSPAYALIMPKSPRFTPFDHKSTWRPDAKAQAVNPPDNA